MAEGPFTPRAFIGGATALGLGAAGVQIVQGISNTGRKG